MNKNKAFNADHQKIETETKKAHFSVSAGSKGRSPFIFLLHETRSARHVPRTSLKIIEQTAVRVMGKWLPVKKSIVSRSPHERTPRNQLRQA